MQNLMTSKAQTLMLMQLARLMPNIDLNYIYNNAACLMSQISTSTLQNNPVQSPASTTKFNPIQTELRVKFEVPEVERTSSIEASLPQTEQGSVSTSDDQEEEAKEEREIGIKIEEYLPTFEEYNSEIDVKKEEMSTLLQRSKKIAKQKVHYKSHESTPSQSMKSGSDEATTESTSLLGKFRTRNNTWTTEEDAKLIELYNIHGSRWSVLAQELGKKSGKQCRDRYMNTLRPGLNFEEWSEEEEKLVLALAEECGKKWSLIATKMPGRSENQVKNKYYSLKNYRNSKNKRKEEGKTINKQADLTNHSLSKAQEESKKPDLKRILPQPAFRLVPPYFQNQNGLFKNFNQPSVSQAGAALFQQGLLNKHYGQVMSLMQQRFALSK